MIKSLILASLIIVSSASVALESELKDITLTYQNNTKLKVWLVIETDMWPNVFVHNQKIGWIQPGTSGIVSLDDSWFTTYSITPKTKMGIGFRDELGNFKICKDSFYLNRPIQITLTGAVNNIVEQGVKCQFSSVEELPEKFLSFRYENQNTEWGNGHSLVAMDPLTQTWKMVNMEIGGNQTSVDGAFPLSLINPNLAPNTPIQFAIHEPNTDNYYLCASLLTANASRKPTNAIRQYSYHFIFKDKLCTVKRI